MKNAIIFHGTDCRPEDFWYGWLKTELEQAGYKVELPYYPDINHEPIERFLPKVLADQKFDHETVLIGHSAGSPLILSILQAIDKPIAQAILVAGYARPKPGRDRSLMLSESYDWEKIRSNVKDIVFINSVEDPWGCNADQGRFMFDNLGGTQIIRNEGHFGSGAYNQPYPKFPLVKALIVGESE